MSNYKKRYAAIDWSVKMAFEPQLVENTTSVRSELSMPMVSMDYKAYECPVTGKTIEGRAAHQENLKCTNCRLLEPGEKESNARDAAVASESENRRRDAAIDGIVDAVASEYYN
mgnify:FL=1